MLSKVLKHAGFRWAGVPVRQYKPNDEGGNAGVLRQTLLGEGDGEAALHFVTRYFEIEPDGFSTLEHHGHPHTVVVLRGAGSVQLNDEQHEITPFDVIYVAPHDVHQFRADRGEPLGFLCIVDRQRDRPIAS